FAAHNHVRVQMGHPEWSWDEYKVHMRSSSRELYPKLYGDRSQEAIDVLYDFYGAHHLAGLEVLPYAAELLAAVHDHKIPMGVVSNKKHEMLLRESTHLGWDKYFGPALVGAGAAVKDKPAADPVSMVLKIMNIQPTQGTMWYVGDTITDMQTAQAANCNAVLVLNGEDKSDLISEFSPYLVVQDCRELARILAD
ncbi:MAG: HAD family hydrolase, partial [Alphaproteobacteria bacterium]|nr:HAD family hydrolase [Alphaproteobacteria bacterium]